MANCLGKIFLAFVCQGFDPFLKALSLVDIYTRLFSYCAESTGNLLFERDENIDFEAFSLDHVGIPIALQLLA